MGLNENLGSSIRAEKILRRDGTLTCVAFAVTNLLPSFAPKAFGSLVTRPPHQASLWAIKSLHSLPRTARGGGGAGGAGGAALRPLRGAAAAGAAAFGAGTEGPGRWKRGGGVGGTRGRKNVANLKLPEVASVVFEVCGWYLGAQLEEFCF